MTNTHIQKRQGKNQRRLVDGHVSLESNESTPAPQNIYQQSPSSIDFYDVLSDYLKSTNFFGSERVGSVEVVPPISAPFSDSQIKTSQELLLLPTVTIFDYSTEDIDANGNKTLINWQEIMNYVDTVGLLMGIHHFNNGIGSVVKEVAGINETCNIRLTTEIFDSEFSRSTGIDTFLRQVFEFPGRPPSALFGTRFSKTSTPLAILSGLYETPQISPYSTSTDLDNRDKFKFFSRLVPSDSGTARAIVDYFRSRLDVTHCGVIYINDAYGGAYVQAFKDNAVDRPDKEQITVKSFGFTDGSEVELKLAVRQMKESGYRVFFGLFYSHHFEPIMNEAVRFGIAGPGYVWIVGDAVGRGFLNDSKFPKGSPLAIAAQGIGIIRPGTLRTLPGDTGFNRFVEAWYHQDDDAISHFNRKQPNNNTLNNADELYYRAELGSFKPDQLQPPDAGGLFLYDSAMGLGLAACRLVSRRIGDNNYFDGKDLFNEFIQSSFKGASGKIKIDPNTGSRDPSTASFLMYNANGVENDKDISFTVSVVLHTVQNSDSPNSTIWQDVIGENFVYSDGTTQPPPVLPPIQGENLNQLNNIRYVGFVLSATVVLCSLFFAFWTCWFRKVRVVRSAQPLFLVMICFGTMLIGLAITTINIDDQVASIWACNVACMATPWLISLGFVVVFSALFSKIWRINKILRGSTRFRRITVSTKDVILPFVVLFTLNTIVLLVWTLRSPLQWERIYRSGIDEFGRQFESYGLCNFKSEKDFLHVFPIMIINLSMLILATVQAYRARNIDTEYSEAKYVAIAIGVILQGIIVGLPVSLLAMEYPSAVSLIRSCVAFIICSSILLLIFVPKMIFVKRWQKELERKEIRRKERAAQAEESKSPIDGTIVIEGDGFKDTGTTVDM